MEKCDLVVVGAGYAGLAAACQLQGRRVLVLERQNSVLEKRRASAGLVLPWGEKPRIKGRDIYYPNLDLYVEEGLKAHCRRLELMVGNESLRLPLEVALVDESRLKGALLKKALAAGAQLEMASPVRRLISEGRSVRVLADKEYQARVVIGADGALGQSAQLMGVEREYQRVLYAREAVVARLDLEKDQLLLQTGGQGTWLMALPDKDRWRVLALHIAGRRAQPADLQRELENFVERRGGDRLLECWPGLVRLYRPQEGVCRPEFILTGDAAAAWAVSGIGGALASGALAGQVAARLLAASQFAPTDYRRQWRRVSGEQTVDWLGWALISLMPRQRKLEKLLQLLHRFYQSAPWLSGLLSRSEQDRVRRPQGS